MAAISSLRALAATALPLLTIAAAQVQAAAIDAEAVREALMKTQDLKLKAYSRRRFLDSGRSLFRIGFSMSTTKWVMSFRDRLLIPRQKRTKRRNVCANSLVRTGQSGLAKMR